jgi:hypothetical protein
LFGILKEIDHLEDLYRDGRTISKLILEKLGVNYVYWMHLAQLKDQWWDLVEVMKLRVA